MANQTCGLYVGTGSLALLALRGTRRESAIAAAGTAQFDAPLDSAGGAIRGLIRNLKLADDQVAIALTKERAILRTAALPTRDPAELRQMARFEAERHLPFHAERHCVSHHVIGQDEVDGSRVLLAAIDGPIVEEALGAVVTAGQVPNGVTLSSIALQEAAGHSRGEALGERPYAVISVGLDLLDIVYAVQRRILYARTVPIHLRALLERWMGRTDQADAGPVDTARLATAARMIDLREAADTGAFRAQSVDDRKNREALVEWLDRLLRELRTTHDYAQREVQCPEPEHILLTGEGALLRNLAAVLDERLGLAVEPFNPAAQMPGAADQQMPFEGHEHTIGLGAALGRLAEPPSAIDLTPVAYYRNLARRRTIRRVATTGVLALATLVLGLITLGHHQQISARATAEYEAINDQMRPRYREIREMDTKLRIINGYLEDKNNALAVFDVLARATVVPREVGLVRIEYVKNDVFSIEGQAQTVKNINDLMAHLRQSGHFEEILQTRQEPGELYRQPLYNFRLECRMKSTDAGDND